MTTFISVAGSLVIGTALWGLSVSALICLVVLVHESGHYAVARLGRLTLSAPIVALPLGGVVLFDQPKSPRPQRAAAAVIAAGPLCGALGGAIAAVLWLLTHDLWLFNFARVSAWFNLINLVPTGMLDGGRLANLAGVPRVVCLAAGIPLIIGHWWFIFFVLAGLISPDEMRAPRALGERKAVRRIAVTGGLGGAALLSLLLVAMPVSLVLR